MSHLSHDPGSRRQPAPKSYFPQTEALAVHAVVFIGDLLLDLLQEPGFSENETSP